MGKFVSTLKATGKVGDIVGSKGAKGDIIMRAYQPEVKNPQTDKQLSARTKFLSGTGLAAAFQKFPGFEKYGKQLGITARNAFVKNVMKDGSITVTKNGDTFESTIDWGAVSISKGIIVPPLFGTPSFTEEAEVSVSWTPEHGHNSNDIVMIAVYQPDTNVAVYSQPTSYGAGSVSCEVPARWSGMEVHVYGFMLAETENGQSVDYQSFWNNGSVEAQAILRSIAGQMNPSMSSYIGHGTIA